MKSGIFLLAALISGLSVLKAQENAKNNTISFSDFNGVQEGMAIHLSWIDYDAANLKEIKVEKSPDASFSSCNMPFEITSCTKGLRYECKDQEPMADIMYYRLKRDDKSGRTEFSEIIAVQYKRPAVEATIFPNPIQSKEFFVNVSGGKTTVSLYNNEGQLIYTSELSPKNFETEIKVEVPMLKGGLYRCIVQGNGNPKNIALIVNE